MFAFSLNFALGFFGVCAMIFTVLFIRFGMRDDQTECITCGEMCYQDYAGIWRHDNRRLDFKHPATPRKVN